MSMSDNQNDEQPKQHRGITVAEAARALGLRPTTVNGAIREGKLRATSLGRQYLISRQAVEEYRQTRLGRKGWTVRRKQEEGQQGSPRSDEPGR